MDPRVGFTRSGFCARLAPGRFASQGCQSLIISAFDGFGSRRFASLSLIASLGRAVYGPISVLKDTNVVDQHLAPFVDRFAIEHVDIMNESRLRKAGMDSAIAVCDPAIAW